MVKVSIFLSLSRQLLFIVPLIYLLPLRFQENGVWYSLPVSDFVSFLVTVFFVFRLMRKFSRLEDGASSETLGSEV